MYKRGTCEQILKVEAQRLGGLAGWLAELFFNEGGCDPVITA
jgi:hypothetical protein